MKAYLRINRTRVFIYFLVILLIIITAAIFILFRINKNLEPVIEEAADNEIYLMIQKEINDVVLSFDKKEYQELTCYEKDNAGNICLIKTDNARINEMNSRISLMLNKRISKISEAVIKIPLGNILKNNFISARGPYLKIKVMVPKGKVKTQIVNVFTSAGINQTRHQITLFVESETTGLIGFKKITNSYKTEVVLSESVIVGLVPNYIGGELLNKKKIKNF